MESDIRKIEDIPTLPQLTVELIHQTFQDEPDIQQVASLIERDATLSAKLFKTVNSAAFGLRAEVKNVQQAISMLGLDTLRATIVGIAVGDYFINSEFGNILDPRKYCVHSLGTGIIMKEVATVLGIKEAEQLFLVGLFHDLGKIALDTFPEGKYQEVLDLVDEGMSYEEAEQQIFSWNNQQVWRLLAKTWNFPTEIQTIHEGTLQGPVTFSTKAFTEDASSMADTLGYSFMPPPKSRDYLALETLKGLSEDELNKIGEAVHKQIEIMNQILDLPAPDSQQVYQILFQVFSRLSHANNRYKKTQSELEFKVEVLEELTQVFTGVITSFHENSISFSVLESLLDGFNADGVFLLNCDPMGNLKGHNRRADQQDESRADFISVAKEKISGNMRECIRSRSAIKIDNPTEDEVLMKCLGNVSLSWLVPIFVRGRFYSLLGLGVLDKGNRKFNSEDFGKILDIISGEVGLSMENSKLYSRVQWEAKTDSLTSISNRRTIMKVISTEFARYQRKPFPLTVALFDMDNFKAINDSRGHLAGDEFLTKAARILKQGMRECDYIGRYGGDEFIALFPGTTTAEAKHIVERIRVELRKFCQIFEGPDIGKMLSVSVGLASAESQMTRADDLILLADRHLYLAKEAGRNLCVESEDAVASPRV